MEILSFALTALALLATPGPTNTLLFTSGAVAGCRRSLPLLAGELLGYQLTIGTLIVVLGPALASHLGLKLALQALCGGFLIHAARGLWMRSAASAKEAVGFREVFLTTLLNPKGFIFASTVIPGDPLTSFPLRLPWLAALSVLIIGVGSTWIYAGTAMQRRTSVWLSGVFCCRAGAVALMAFAGLLWWSAVSSALSL
jgi:threonine/homoserine/homoserine lactone efflux protein